MKLNRHDFVIVCAGSVIMVGNPDYNEHDPSTHDAIAVVVDQDIVVCMADDYIGTRLTNISKKDTDNGK